MMTNLIHFNGTCAEFLIYLHFETFIDFCQSEMYSCQQIVKKVFVDIDIRLIAVCIYRLVMISIKWSETAQKNTLASTDVTVTQLLCYHMLLLYFVCNHLILLIA